MTNSPLPTLPSDKPTLWYATDQLPARDEEDLLIVFHGLLSFCYLQCSDTVPHENLQHCEVGVFNQDRDHQLYIETVGGLCSSKTTYTYDFDQLYYLSDKTFKIDVVGAENPGVAFYQTRAPFNRVTTHDDNDFRWLIDVESPDLYNRPVRDHKPFYGPRLLVKHGTFFTLEKTSSTFGWVKRGDINTRRGLGSVAFCTAVKITLGPRQQARFQFRDENGKPVSCLFDKKTDPHGPPAKIYFTNICSSSNPTDSDFYHHFESFTPPAGETSWDLYAVNSVSEDHPCGGMPAKSILITDPAPCHGMGYGQSGGGSGG